MEQKWILEEAMELYKKTKKALSETHEVVVGLTADEKKLADKIGCDWEFDMNELSPKECVAALYIACMAYAVGRKVDFIREEDYYHATCDKLRAENSKLPDVYYWLGDTADYDPEEDITHIHSAML